MWLVSVLGEITLKFYPLLQNTEWALWAMLFQQMDGVGPKVAMDRHLRSLRTGLRDSSHLYFDYAPPKSKSGLQS